jgi:hypothetical protein
MVEDNRSEKVLKALNWQPQKKVSQVSNLQQGQASASQTGSNLCAVHICTSCLNHLDERSLQESFFSAVQDNIDALGMTVCSSHAANSSMLHAAAAVCFMSIAPAWYITHLPAG